MREASRFISQLASGSLPSRISSDNLVTAFVKPEDSEDDDEGDSRECKSRDGNAHARADATTTAIIPTPAERRQSQSSRRDAQPVEEHINRSGGLAQEVSARCTGEAIMHHHERGCLPCTNCLVTVPQDKYYAVENFGKFSKVLSPGLHFGGFDIFGCCVSYRSITARMEQSFVTVTTKTQDNVFVSCQVAVQHAVMEKCVDKAMYKLSDVHGQIDSYVSDVVRSYLPLMTLDEAFEKKDDISDAVEKKLKEEMAGYGHEIRKALVTEVQPDKEVVNSMNEINKQERLRDAAITAAEAEKIKIVKAAEAAADSAQLQGEGIARQRRAIIDGLRDSITHGSDEKLSTEKVSELLLITQYFETLRHVAAQNKSSTVFLPHGAGAVEDIAAQIRMGVLQGAAGAPGQVRM
eukprot:TRINITY_DN16270_c0_g1_i1.p1 TRINITY_DN16270_c0_g1~~TRINITY_DN16270_c0_g1_i1.p1  ORF type:complete len:407 (+),score=90.57 TRINITY_DN16270_c0_g1_i1:92-1312(+)